MFGDIDAAVLGGELIDKKPGAVSPSAPIAPVAPAAPLDAALDRAAAAIFQVAAAQAAQAAGGAAGAGGEDAAEGAVQAAVQILHAGILSEPGALRGLGQGQGQGFGDDEDDDPVPVSVPVPATAATGADARKQAEEEEEEDEFADCGIALDASLHIDDMEVVAAEPQAPFSWSDLPFAPGSLVAQEAAVAAASSLSLPVPVQWHSECTVSAEGASSIHAAAARLIGAFGDPSACGIGPRPAPFAPLSPAESAYAASAPAFLRVLVLRVSRRYGAFTPLHRAAAASASQGASQPDWASTAQVLVSALYLEPQAAPATTAAPGGSGPRAAVCTLLLRDDWLQCPVQAGDTLHVVAVNKGQPLALQTGVRLLNDLAGTGTSGIVPLQRAANAVSPSAAALLRLHAGDPRLCAFLVATAGSVAAAAAGLTPEAIRDRLLDQMLCAVGSLPAGYCCKASMPLQGPPSDSPHAVIVVSNTANALVVSPDRLLAPTKIAGVSTCMRRAVLQELMGDAGGGDLSSAVALLGTIKHTVFEAGFKLMFDGPAASRGWNPQQLSLLLGQYAAVLVREPAMLLELYQAGMSNEDALEKVNDAIPGIVEWLSTFTSPGQRLHAASGRARPVPPFFVNALVATEDAVWSPIWGIRGVFDATVDIAIPLRSARETHLRQMLDPKPELPPSKPFLGRSLVRRIPWELKTGRKPSAGSSGEHRAQISIYGLLMNERYGHRAQFHMESLPLAVGAGQGLTGGPAMLARVRSLPEPYKSSTIFPNHMSSYMSTGSEEEEARKVDGVLVYSVTQSDAAQDISKDVTRTTSGGNCGNTFDQLQKEVTAMTQLNPLGLHSSVAIQALWVEQRSLLVARNRLSAALDRAEAAATEVELRRDPATNAAILADTADAVGFPPILQNTVVCRKCFALLSCTAVYACRELPARREAIVDKIVASSQDPSETPEIPSMDDLPAGIQSLYQSLCGHMFAAGPLRDYVSKWLKLVDLEASAESERRIPVSKAESKSCHGTAQSELEDLVRHDRASTSRKAISIASAERARRKNKKASMWCTASGGSTETVVGDLVFIGQYTVRSSALAHPASQNNSMDAAEVIIVDDGESVPGSQAPIHGASTGISLLSIESMPRTTLNLLNTTLGPIDRDIEHLHKTGIRKTYVPRPSAFETALDNLPIAYEYLFTTFDCYTSLKATQSSHRSLPQRSLKDLTLSVGDMVTLSADGYVERGNPGPYGLSQGTVVFKSSHLVIVRGPQDIMSAFPEMVARWRPPSSSAAPEPARWRIDCGESQASLRIIKDNLIRFALGPTIPYLDRAVTNILPGAGVDMVTAGQNRIVLVGDDTESDLDNTNNNSRKQEADGNYAGDVKRQRLLVYMDSPRFQPLITFPWGAIPNDSQMSELLTDKSVKDTFGTPPETGRSLPASEQLLMEFLFKLNEDQRMAVAKAHCARDFLAILGMPGTGKTTTLSFIIRCLVLLGQTVVVTSHTHTAVDNILLKLIADGVPVLRLGRASSVHPGVRPHCVEELVSTGNISSVSGLTDRIRSASVVGVTCLGIRHPIFSERKFDYCFVDEAGQIPEPIVLGPLRTARVFCLVGDHNQLPPLVVSSLARAGGMGLSLFKRLVTASPEAVVALRYQFRMNEDVQFLANEIFYDNQLRCGDDSTRNRMYQLPRLSSSEGVCVDAWASASLAPHRRVVFLNTDNLVGMTMRGTETRRRVFIPTSTPQTLAPEGTVRTNQPEGESGALQNLPEACIVSDIVKTILFYGGSAGDIGVMSPYRAQLRLIRNVLDYAFPPKERPVDLGLVEVDTIDRFQGRDKPVVIVSLVRSNTRGDVGQLLADVARLNVAITRAKGKLILIGSYNTLRRGPPALVKLLELIERRQWVYPIPAFTETSYPGQPWNLVQLNGGIHNQDVIG
jgi:hypothetical protein